MRVRPPIPFLKSFVVAGHGLAEALADQRNLRIHLVCAIVVMALAGWLRVSVVEWLLLGICIGNVMAVEMLNTAIETVVDYISLEEHPLARKSKDVAAGAVLVVSLMAAAVGAAILLPKLASL